MTNNVSIFTTLAGSLPWQEIFNWLAGIGLPALFALWRKHASQNARSATILAAVIQGVEESTQALGKDGNQVKRAIRDNSIVSGVQAPLDAIVQQVTASPDKSTT